MNSLQMPTLFKDEVIQQNKPIGDIKQAREFDYQLIIPFPETIKEKVSKIRQEFATKFGSAPPRSLGNHLTLAYWTGRLMNEERLHQQLSLIAMGAAPFQILLKDYGAEPSHRVFIHVGTKSPLVNLGKQLKTTHSLLQTGPSQQPRFLVPDSITIAQKLLPWQFEKGRQLFANRQFTAKFIAKELLWIKRNGTGEPWQIIDRMAFQNLPVSTNHGQLFAA